MEKFNYSDDLGKYFFIIMRWCNILYFHPANASLLRWYFSFFIESQQSSENPFYVRNIYIHCAKHDFSLIKISFFDRASYLLLWVYKLYLHLTFYSIKFFSSSSVWLCWHTEVKSRNMRKNNAERKSPKNGRLWCEKWQYGRQAFSSVWVSLLATQLITSPLCVRARARSFLKVERKSCASHTAL